jgi:hypothetical protein
LINHRPIVVSAQTNHALDHILRAVYDEEITTSIIRFGYRSKDAVLSKLTMGEHEKKWKKKKWDKWNLDRKYHFARMKKLSQVRRIKNEVADARP